MDTKSQRNAVRNNNMDPILCRIIEKYYQSMPPNEDGSPPMPPTDEVGDFTNRIVLCKKKDMQYYLRMVVLRLDGEFHCLDKPH